MIQQLLSSFRTYPEKYCSLSESKRTEITLTTNLCFYYGNKILMAGTIGWVLYQLYIFLNIRWRPEELFVPSNYFGKIFMPSFPSDVMFFMIGFMAIALALSIIFFKDTFLVRGMLAIAVMWLNLFKWSFGGLGHQAHLLVLAHLLGIFILSKDIPANRANRQISKSIEWFYLGLLATYTYAGFWKLLALIYKLVLKPNEINWLSPEGALYTSIIGYFGSDMRIDQVAGLFTFPIFWQVSFLLTCFILSFSFLAAFREPLRIWIALAIITFHLINNIVFNVEFYTPLWVLLVLFFPYQRILSKDFIFISPTIDKKFSGKGNNAFYERSYENGEKDKFYNFYAYREMIYDKKKWWRGLLYFPFIDLTAMAFWKMKYALHKPLKS